VQILRHLGFAARFVSGYLIQLVPDIKSVTGPQGTTTDFTDLHAWCEVYVPGAGWIGLDPTSGLLAGEGHIPLAATPEPASAAAISGGVDEAETEFGFHMEVCRVAQSPRVTKPYSPDQWAAVQRAGEAVDRKLAALGMRLTMGGEPTFVAASDRDAAEWNTDALGPTKRAYAGRLLRRLVKLWSPGAALTHNMGKHYPGEQLPRWALYSHWRADGEPVWTDPALLASDDDRDNATAADASRFATLLAERLQVDPGLVQGAHEDIHYYLWKEQRLPANVVVEDAKLADELERKRLARVFGQGLSAEVGSVLPIRRVIQDGVRRWQAGRWFFRGDHLFLIPGDSPIGLRLPLASLPWMSPEDARRVQEHEADPFAWRDDLPPHAALTAQRALRAQMAPEALDQRALRSPRPGEGTASSIEDFRPQPQDIPVVGESDPGVVRTALSVESRDGKLHIFFPPLFAAEDWLEMVAAVEATAAEMGRKVVLEGYLPPSDPRLLQFLRHARSRRDRGERAPRHRAGRELSAAAPAVLYEEARQDRAGRREVHAGRAACRHRRRQPHGDGRGGAGGQPLPAAAGPAEVAGRLLAQPSLAVLPVQRVVHRPDQPASARRRGARRCGARAGDGAGAGATHGRAVAALAHRPHLPQPAGRHDGQHAPHGVLHRQDVRPQQRGRPPRAGGIPRLRDAAALADVAGAATAAALAGRRLLAAAPMSGGW
jgi:hypothetical protein